MPGPWLDMAKRPEAWFDLNDEPGSFVEYACVDSKGAPQGTAVLQVAALYEEDATGRYVKALHCGASDPYYQWYADPANKGERGAKGNDLYHMCRSCSAACEANSHRGAVHVDCVRQLSRSEVERKLGEWRRKGVAIKALPEDARGARQPSSGKKPPAASSRQSRGESPEPKRSAKEGRTSRKRGRSGGKRVSSSRSSSSAGEDESPNPAKALDKELRELGLESSGDEAATPGKAASLKQKLKALKERVNKGSSAGKHPSKGSPQAEIQRRLSSQLPSVRKDLKKDKKKKQKKRLEKLLRQLQGDNSDSTSGSEEEDFFAVGSSGRDLRSKRLAFKRIAKEEPGRLLTVGLSQLREYLNTTFGEDDEDELGPCVVKYLLTCFLPTYGLKRVGDANYRELRTLAMSLDGLLKGQVTRVLDILMQRFKAVTMSIKDNSWSAAKHLELLPTDPGPSATSVDEEELVRRVQAGELKLEELVARLRKAH